MTLIWPRTHKRIQLYILYYLYNSQLFTKTWGKLGEYQYY